MNSQLGKLALTFAAAVVAACGRDDTTVVGDRVVMMSDTAAGVIDTAPASTARAVTVILSDENIIALLDTAYDAMLEADQLAMDRSDNEQVRQFASRAVTQNAASRRAVITTAQRLGTAPVLPDDDAVEGHAEAMASMRQRAGSAFDEIYIDQALEVRKGLINEIDEALRVERQAEGVKQLMRELKAQLEADVKVLEGLKS
jgi:predicted outer membrane protein